MLVALGWAAGPARAQNNNTDRIRSLEEELNKLKAEQIELKEDATAAAEAMPTFTYRPGSGLSIEAADKSWSLRSTIESHVRMLFESGRDQAGRTQGELMLRRFRPGWFFCIDNCLWEIEATFDLDRFRDQFVISTGSGSYSSGEIASMTANCRFRWGRVCEYRCFPPRIECSRHTG